jgi:uroporphyrinogen decarboxylase
MQQWVKNVLLSDKRNALPIMTHPGIDFIGKNVQDAVTNGQVHFDAIVALQKHYPAIAATMIMDLTVEAEAFGSPISFAPHEVPSVSGRIVTDLESVQALKVPTLEAGRVPQYLLAGKLAAEHIADVPVLAGCIGPFSLAGRLFDMTEIMTAAFIEPETVKLLLNKCTDFIISYIKAFKANGVNGVLIAEPAAGMLSEDMCDQFSSIFVKKIVEETQDENFTVILHNCGNTGHVTQSMVSTGAAGLHFGNKIDMTEVLRTVPSNVLVLGNLDPVGVFKMGTPKSMKAAVAELLDKTKEYKNFVLSSGCDTPPGVPSENIDAFFDAVNNWK